MKDLIQKRLEDYHCQTAQEEENAVNEITQEVILFGLSKSGFFQHASFHGGTCLRIIHGLDRFSEDLDFALNRQDETFDFSPHLKKTEEMMNTYGYNMEIAGKDNIDSNVRKRFLKDDSLKKLLTFEHFGDFRKKIRVKIELDIHPPKGAVAKQEFLEFPVDFSIMAHDPGSLFAGKCHALLCREFAKGRDWYDFTWYISKKIPPNYALLSAALDQVGPWQGQAVQVDSNWLQQKLRDRVQKIDWKKASEEVSRFLKPERKESLDLWSEPFFLQKIEKLNSRIP